MQGAGGAKQGGLGRAQAERTSSSQTRRTRERGRTASASATATSMRQRPRGAGDQQAVVTSRDVTFTMCFFSNFIPFVGKRIETYPRMRLIKPITLH